MLPADKFLIYSCLILYILNYITGWLIYYGKIKVGKKIHQVMFASLIINLILIIFFSKIPFTQKIFCALSLTAMVLLPFGKKGGRYHIALSSAGLIMFLTLFFN